MIKQCRIDKKMILNQIETGVEEPAVLICNIFFIKFILKENQEKIIDFFQFSSMRLKYIVESA